MKNRIKKFMAASAGIATMLAYGAAVPAALAAVTLTIAPASEVTSPLVLPANSAPTVLFNFSLNSSASETLSNVTVEIDKANTITAVTGSHLASLAVYKDNGDGVFNPTSDTLMGSQGTVNINSPTVISDSYSSTASGEFFVTISTSAAWTSGPPSDSIIATLPTNGINTSINSPTTASPITTAPISANLLNLAQTIISQQLSATGTVAISQPVYDTATLSNTNSSAEGSVNYNVYLGAGCLGMPTFSDTQPVTFSAPASSRSFSTTATGMYSWQAVYSGDANNTNATSSCASEYVGSIPPSTMPISPVPTSSGSLPVTGIPPASLLALLLSGVAALVIKKTILS